jgi:hypothetical protein
MMLMIVAPAMSCPASSDNDPIATSAVATARTAGP